ncbi:MAG: amino acid permease [Lewinellaceae bacterium]|nr:amino acid permease [Lewinellaceae bacterium]
MSTFQSLFRRKPLASLQLQESQTGLQKALNVRDLTAFGIAAIIGAGIFSTIGNAAANGGPAITLLFIFTAVACGFSALCYAQFASTVPVSGSAYTYAYVAFGELIAWIIGWDLLLEYAIGNIAVAISWSDYFTGFLQGFGIHFPAYLSMDYLSAHRGFQEASGLMANGATMETLPSNLRESYLAWSNAPGAGALKLIADIPALIIVFLITLLVYIGIRETRRASNLMVGLKLSVVTAVIIIGAFYIHPSNWSPFSPNGFGGVMKGVAAVFFAYIGFDAISTTTEECQDPKRDMPRAIVYSLIICTILYVIIALTLTGMVSYKELGVGDPLAFVFQRIGLHWIGGVIAFTALIAMAGVLLVFQLGQPRIWMSMSRDGLLPGAFARIHPRFQTPSFATVVTGFVVAVPALFMNLTEVTDLTSIGTLFAFVVVCGGVLLMDKTQQVQGAYTVPYINGRYIVPLLLAGILVYTLLEENAAWSAFLEWGTGHSFFEWGRFQHKIPYLIFGLTALSVGVLSFRFQLSLIPVLGLLSCLYLMSELGYTNWLRFVIWLVIGLAIYFSYSRANSKLAAGKS